jgi:hypothetical protein
MARDVSVAFASASSAGTIRPAVLLEMEFYSGTLRLWDGLGDLEWNGVTFTGGGRMLSGSIAEETQELEAKNAVFELNGAPDSVVTLALTESPYSGRPARAWLALFDASGAMIEDPVRIFSGKMDTMPILDDPQKPVIQLNVENDLARLSRPKERRWTHEDQQMDYSGDLFFEFVTQMQDKEITWGN